MITPHQNELISQLLVHVAHTRGGISSSDDKHRELLASTRRMLVDNFAAINSETAPSERDALRKSQ